MSFFNKCVLQYFMSLSSDFTGLQPKNCVRFFDCFLQIFTETGKNIKHFISSGFLVKLVFLV